MPDSIEPIAAVGVNSAVQHTPTTANTASTAAVNDTVTLSETAQATLLQGEGQSVAEIAVALGLTTSEVMSDLGITAPLSQPSATKQQSGSTDVVSQP
jgi:hypothetical protein